MKQFVLALMMLVVFGPALARAAEYVQPPTSNEWQPPIKYQWQAPETKKAAPRLAFPDVLAPTPEPRPVFKAIRHRHVAHARHHVRSAEVDVPKKIEVSVTLRSGKTFHWRLVR